MGVGGARSSWRRRFSLGLVPVVVAAALQSWFLLGVTSVPPARAQTPKRPNIILVLTDDQRFDTLHVMPEVQRLARRGMLFRRAIVSNALCCPSRATILTGRYSHTTGVYTNLGTHGGWPVFQRSEPETIATALDAAGYRTALIGKYLNGYMGDGLYVPPGWDRWSVFAGENGRYFDYRMFDNIHGLVRYGSRPRDYSTDVIRRLSASFILNTAAARPVFLMAAPYAPHGGFLAAPRHDGEFASTPISLGPAVNELNVADKPRYIRRGAMVERKVIKRRIRNQWETLLAVDQLVGRLVDVLGRTGRINDTVFIFTSDNGFSNHEHRWTGKEVLYEESIRVPLVIAYPRNIPRGSVTDELASNVDLAPTIADFAGISLAADGVSLRPLLLGDASSARGSILLEHLQRRPDTVPTYCGVRTPSFAFVHYVTGEEELYDLGRDPRQLRNVVGARPNTARVLRSRTRSLCQPTPPGFSW